MKTLSIVSIFILAWTSGFCQNDIRNVVWGSSKEVVKKSETLPLFSEKDGLMYKGNIGGKEFVISYVFTGNKLSRVVYIYSGSHTNDNNYISSYNELKAILSKKYQEPVSNVDWKNDLFKDNEDQWGLALSAGHVTFLSIWETEKTNITLVCNGENFKISMGIVYTGKAFSDILNTDKENQNLKDF